jgi:hypothetical protein
VTRSDSDQVLQRLARTQELLLLLVERVDALSNRPVETVTVGNVSQTVPVIRSFDELMHAVGEEVGRRHGEAVARAEHGAIDAWQVALGALSNLRVCIGSALQATPPQSNRRGHVNVLVHNQKKDSP